MQAILLHHDPHHTLTRVRLATLLSRTDPVAAASVLNDAIDADDRPYRPYALLARIHRNAGRLAQADPKGQDDGSYCDMLSLHCLPPFPRNDETPEAQAA